jgi:hypothetical protein
MDQKHAELMLARFGPLDALLDGLIKKGTIQELIQQPAPIFEMAMTRIRRAHLVARGYVFIDEDHPAGCPTCEG